MQKIIRRFFAFVVLSLFTFMIVAQAQKQVKGTVKDSNGDPLVGVTVMVKGTTKATLTDIDGNYTLSVPANGKTLVAKYVGMENNEQEVKGSIINFSMKDAGSSLDEVVVIGYGSVKKKDLTGSVATVKGESLANIPVPNVAEALTGKLAGVRMTTTDGSPDADVVIRVRGGGSITQDNSPLFVVDGFPAANINDIPASDIQDITVLRDASSTAIYGARGANGVILVTTKSAEGGKTRVNYNTFFQTKKIAKRLDAMNTYDYVMSNYEYALLRGTSNVDAFVKKFGVYDDLDLYKSIEPIDWQEDMFGANVLSQQHNISITGGNKATSFSVSGTYDYNGGLMEKNDFSRYAFQFKLNHQIADNLKFGANFRVKDQLVNGSGTQGGNYKIRTSQAITGVATRGLSDNIEVDPSTMTDEEYQEYLQSIRSLSDQAQDYWKKKNDRGYDFNFSLDWTVLKGLVLHGEAGYNYGFNEQKNWYAGITSAASYKGGLPYATWTKTNTNTMREAVTLTYDLKWEKDHHFNVMIGQETSSDKSKYTTMQGLGYSEAYTAEQVFDNFGLAQGNVTASSYVEVPIDLRSYFGRFNYIYKEKYLFTATMRADQSCIFEKGKQWGYFPSLAASWRIMEEPFMAPSKDWLSNLKLRFSFGTAGNNRIDKINQTYALLGADDSKRYGVGESADNAYKLSSEYLYNPTLKWETTVSRDLGLDFGFFNERINGNVDLYWNTGKELLIPHTTTAPGYSKVIENCAQTSSKGVEVSLNASIVQKKNFTLDANFNIGFNKTNIDKLANGLESMPFQSNWASTDNKNTDDYIAKVGEPVGQVYGWVCDGYYTTSDFDSYDMANKKYILKSGVATTSLEGGTIGIRPGAMKLRDISGPNGVPDGTVDANDLTIIGDTNPLCQGGFGFSSTFLHGFDMTMNFTYSIGNDIYNANKIASSQRYRSGSYPNMLNTMRQGNSYSYMNPETGTLMTSLEDLAYYNEGGNGKGAKEYWSPYSFGDAVVVPTDWAIEDGSFLRLQSVTLGYTFPKKWMRNFKIQNLRIYGTATNLFVLTGYSGYDPEVSSYARNNSYSALTPGIDYSSYPKSRGFTFGLNVTL